MSLVFVIGANKTGTNKNKKLKIKLGYTSINRQKSEGLLMVVANKEYDKLFNLIDSYKSSNVLAKDIPYNVHDIYEILENRYPNAKFILTIRDSESWFNSIKNFHGKTLKINSTESIKRCKYSYPGFMWDYYRHVLNYDESKKHLDNKDNMINAYNEYNKNAIEYFANKQDKFLLVNIMDDNSDIAKKICDFLQIEYTGQIYDHEMKTEQL